MGRLRQLFGDGGDSFGRIWPDSSPPATPTGPPTAFDLDATIRRFEAARRRADRVHARATDDDRGQRARDTACEAELVATDELLEAIRESTPGEVDDSLPQAYLHSDGRIFVALPEGIDLEIARRIERVLVVPPDRLGGQAN